MSHGIWIKMRRAISSDPDVFRIAELTGLDRFSVVGRLHAVWSWADEHDVANRDAVSVTQNYIDRVTECAGFADAMRHVGWLAGSDGALMFPNFERHNGYQAKRKAQNVVRNQRLRTKPDGNSDAGQRDAVSVTICTPDKTRHRQDNGRKPADAGALSADLDEVLNAWNASVLTSCRKLTDKRRSVLRSRLADADWKADWRQALDRAAKSSFCRGENDRSWRADIDWFLRPDTVTQLLEGKFDDRNGQRGPAAADDVMERHTAEVLAAKRAEQAANGGPAS